MTQKRIIYFLAFLILLTVEVVIALFVHDRFIRPYVGDVLVVILIYCLVRVVLPEKVRFLSVWVFLFACVTEFMQYLNIVELLGVQDNMFLRVLIGTVFDWRDIAAYAAGGGILFVWEILSGGKILIVGKSLFVRKVLYERKPGTENAEGKNDTYR